MRVLITIVLVACFFSTTKIGYLPSDTTLFPNHLLFPLFHANIFHLLCNLIALWAIKGKLYIVPSVFISLIASYLPQYLDTMPTYGFSAILFAIVGIKWGKYFYTQYSTPFICLNLNRLERNIKYFVVYTIAPLLLTALIPNINASIHFYALAIGLLYGVVTNLLRDEWNIHVNRK